MKKYFPLLLLFFVIIILGSIFYFFSKSGAFIVNKNENKSASIQKTSENDKQEWTWDEARHGKLRVLDIGQKDCVSCVKMHQITEEMDEEYRGKISFSIIDIDEYPHVIEQFGINTVPTVVVVDGMGRVLYRKEDVWYKTEIREFFARLGIRP